MANAKQIAILKRGVPAWNKWGEKNRKVPPSNWKPDFCGMDRVGVDLAEADLINVDLRGGDLSGANLRRASLKGTDLTDADLSGAILTRADLRHSDFTKACLGSTVFGDNDLSTVKGLETVEHVGPSPIGLSTIYRSKGKIPETFLRGAGVPEDFITYMKSLVGKAIDFYSCFISYSSQDADFAQRLYADLQVKNVRC